ncbi:hypothetical protein SAMN02744775_03574 [Enterobacter sp. CC120223-11]|nr:hypothetical protein SAMN02744775_03574 [Enterobacter sp. CC120223-11]
MLNCQDFLANGIVLPISAFLSRLLGPKLFFIICIVMFTICSFLCGARDGPDPRRR